MCDEQRLSSACAYAQSDQSLCLSLEYSMSVKLLTEHLLESLSFKRRLHRLVWMYTCQNVKLLEISSHGSFTIYLIQCLDGWMDGMGLDGMGWNGMGWGGFETLAPNFRWSRKHVSKLFEGIIVINFLSTSLNISFVCSFCLTAYETVCLKVRNFDYPWRPHWE